MRLLVKRAFKDFKAGQIIESGDLPPVVVNPDGKEITLDAEKSLGSYIERGLVVLGPKEDPPQITSLRPADEPTPLAEPTPEIVLPAKKSSRRWGLLQPPADAEDTAKES